MTNWNELPDEAILEVAKWLQEPREMANFCQVDQRSYRLTSNASTLFRQAVQDIMLQEDSNIISSMTTSWKQLAFYQELKSSGWLEENRVGFAMASTTIAPDDDEDFPIKNSRSRLEVATKWFERSSFPEPKFIIDSHCGILGPRHIAAPFSRHRGLSVVQALLGEEPSDHHDMLDDDAGLPLLEKKLEFRAWGRRISDIAGADPSSSSQSPHPYAEVARQGYGWAEVYFDLDGLILPERPYYYQNSSPEPYRVDTTRLRLNSESESDDEEDGDAYAYFDRDVLLRQFAARERRWGGYTGLRREDVGRLRYASSSTEDSSSSSSSDTDDDDDDDDEMDYDDFSISADDNDDDVDDDDDGLVGGKSSSV